MDVFRQLAEHYFLLQSGAGNHQALIDWALERLSLNEEGDDLNIVLLAAATTREEVLPLTADILESHCGIDIYSAWVTAGKHVADLYTAYLAGTETLDSLCQEIVPIADRLNFPYWLDTLLRNLTHATHRDGDKAPFEQELAYIAGLWKEAVSVEEFETLYRQEVSDSHDLAHRTEQTER